MKAVIWDIGGVLLRTEDWSLRERWEQKLNLEPMELTRLVFANEASKQASLGKAGIEDVWKNVQETLALPDEEFADLRRDFFASDKLDQNLIEYIRGLQKNGFLVGLISNAWPDMRGMLHLWDITSCFDPIIISAEVGIVKPDPAIFRLTLEKMQVSAGDAVFIDDFIENVQGAEAVGMHAIHFTDPEKAIRELDSLLSRPF